MKKQRKPKPHPKQIVVNAIDAIHMFIRGTSYETYVKKELEKIKGVLVNK